MPDKSRLMRSQTSVPVPNGSSTEIAGPNPNRVALIIGAPVTNRVTLSFAGDAVLDSGINLYPGGAPFMLLYEHIGEAVRESIQAIASVAPETITVVDVFG